MFVIEDEIHAEWSGEFQSFEEAFAELQARSQIAWDSPPNQCPCMSWKTCGREYSIIEFDSSTTSWAEKSRIPVLTVSAEGTKWERGFENFAPNMRTR
jgi:hypothetical protein